MPFCWFIIIYVSSTAPVPQKIFFLIRFTPAVDDAAVTDQGTKINSYCSKIEHGSFKKQKYQQKKKKRQIAVVRINALLVRDKPGHGSSHS